MMDALNDSRARRAKGTHVLVVGIDAFRSKNLNKTRSLRIRGVEFTVIAMDRSRRSTSLTETETNVRTYGCGKRFPRIRTLVTMAWILLTRRIDLVEIYPESYITLAFFILARVFRQPVIIVARGLEHRIAEGRIQGTRLLALKAVYRGANTVVYNELYMRDLLTTMGVRRLEFLPNSIELPEVIDRSGREGCNFLFMNSFKAFRHPETVVMALNSLCDDGHGSGIRLRVVGFRQQLGYSGNLEREQELKALAARHPDQIELSPWTDDTREHLIWGDVFLLPADIVFLNYALLEAMGTGMPAIVQESNGSSMIVEHGLTGAIVPNHAGAWAAAMLALARDPSARQRQGAAARAKVAAQFSADVAADRWLRVYWSCRAHRQPEPTASTTVHEHASAGDRFGGSAF